MESLTTAASLKSSAMAAQLPPQPVPKPQPGAAPPLGKPPRSSCAASGAPCQNGACCAAAPPLANGDRGRCVHGGPLQTVWRATCQVP